uniref:Uncharacterized protein n=1 Tax=Arundo donax TaxID=35708 RepID=A0A0A9B9L1_ARUDO
MDGSQGNTIYSYVSDYTVPVYWECCSSFE